MTGRRRPRATGRHRHKEEGEAFASPGLRLQAAAYDWFVLTVLGTVVMTAVAWISGEDLFENRGALAVALLALLVLDALYEVPSTALSGQTIGKRMAVLRVTALDGSAPGWSRALRRWIAFIPLGLMWETAVLGSVVVGASVMRDEQHRGLHDRFAGTVVVVAPDASAPPLEPGQAGADRGRRRS